MQLGSNAWVNGFIALIFFVFGLSLLGAFEITIPSGVLTKLNAASGQGGFVGTLLMGLTFALASFACVGPFMGTLLAASVGADKLRPVLGMVVFATGLAAALLPARAVPEIPAEAAALRRMAGARESRDGLPGAGRDAEVPLQPGRGAADRLPDPRAFPRRMGGAVRDGGLLSAWLRPAARHFTRCGTGRGAPADRHACS